MENGPAVIIDIGTETSKVGLSSLGAPSSIFPTYVARLSSRNRGMFGTHLPVYWVGEEAVRRRGVAKMRSPLQDGYINNYDDITALWKYVFGEKLGVEPKKHPILMTEEIGNQRSRREKTTQIVFETLEAPFFYLAKQSVMALYSTGQTSGVVLSCGYNPGFAVPVYEGFALQNAVARLDVGGRDLTDYFCKLISERGCALSTTSERLEAAKCKEEVCYVARDFNKETELISTLGKSAETPFELPDGNKIWVDKERFLVPEALFQPSVIGFKAAGAHIIVQRSIGRCDNDIRRLLYQNIVPAGGSVKYPGFINRLHSEMLSLAPSSATVNILSSPEPLHSAWVGGSMLAALSTFKEVCISDQEYQETGPNIIQRKCM